MTTLLEQIRFLLDGANVSRFHTLETIHRRTVAAHSWGVAQLIFLLSETGPRLTLIQVALSHDLAEQVVGDIPAPLKWRDAELSEFLENTESNVLGLACLPTRNLLSAAELLILDMADYLEGMMCCIQERRLGNKNAEFVYQRWVEAFTNKFLPRATEKQKDIFFTIQELYGEINE